MVKKFADFDAYQLAKYNKAKRKKKKTLQRAETKISSSSSSTFKELIRSLHICSPPLYVMCILGSKYPTTQEDFHTCRLPGNFDPGKSGIDFTLICSLAIWSFFSFLSVSYVNRVFHYFEKHHRSIYALCTYLLSFSGKRMKLPTPETWETHLSHHGNKASTWEELIDHRKLPFMAMLRNLRNLIFTGVKRNYHQGVMRKLTVCR